MKVTISGEEYVIINNSYHYESEYNHRHAICADDNGNLYAIGTSGTSVTQRPAHILKSTNNGASWTYLSKFGYDAYLSCVSLAFNKHTGNIYFAWFYANAASRMVRGYFTPSGVVTSTGWVSSANGGSLTDTAWYYAKATSIIIDNDGFIHLCWATRDSTITYQRYTKVHYNNYLTERNSGNWYNINTNTIFNNTNTGVAYPMSNNITVIYCYKSSTVYRFVLNTSANPITIVESGSIYTTSQFSPSTLSLSVAESDDFNTSYFVVRGTGSLTGGSSNNDCLMFKETLSGSNSFRSEPLYMKNVYPTSIGMQYYHNTVYKKNRLYINVLTQFTNATSIGVAVISIGSDKKYVTEMASKTINDMRGFLLISNKNRIFAFDYNGYFGYKSMAYSNIKRWTGTTYAYDIESVKRWSGTQYQNVKVKRWDGVKYVYLN